LIPYTCNSKRTGIVTLKWWEDRNTDFAAKRLQPNSFTGQYGIRKIIEHIGEYMTIGTIDKKSSKSIVYPRNELILSTLSVVIIILLLLAVPGVAVASGEIRPVLSGDTQSGKSMAPSSGIEELARILVDKGILKREDLAILSEQKGDSGISALTELLRSKGFLTAGEADRVARKAEAGAITLYYERDPKEVEKMTQDVALELKKDFREKVKAEIKEEVLQETKKEILTAAAPEWSKRIRFGGDIRLRYQGDYFGRSNDVVVQDPNNLTQTLNLTEDRHRIRVRARLGATADVNEMTEAGVRITTGNTTNPVTANQTMGNYENKYSVVLDQAYLKLKPFTGLTFWGGRTPNPFFHNGLIWYDDLTFDTVAASYARPVTEKLSGFLTAGIFPLQEFEFTSKDKWLYAGQVGFDYKPLKGITGKLGVAYYYYKNTQGTEIDPSYPNDWQQYSATPSVQKGNTLFNINPLATDYTQYKLALAPEYHELNITGALDVGFWDPVHVVISGDYVKNLGFNYNKVVSLVKPEDNRLTEDTYGYQVGLSVGYLSMQRLGDWRIYGYYRYLGADAVIDALVDPDFHLGGTNAKGWVLGGELGLAKNLWLSAKWASSNEIGGAPMTIDSLFFNVSTRF
jgi:hypothetical protein